MKTILCCVLLFWFCFAVALASADEVTPSPTPVIKLPKVEVNAASQKSADPRIDPFTNTPYIAVHNADIVESVIFIDDFQRAHPQEHAVLLVPESKNCYDSLIAAVAFSWKGQVYLHSYRIGDVVIPGSKPEQIDADKEGLYTAFTELVELSYKKYFEQQGTPYPLPKNRFVEMLMDDTLPHFLPNNVIFDNKDVQTRRVGAYLVKLGFPCAYFSNHWKETFYVDDRVFFFYNGFQYAWYPRGSFYVGLAAKVYMPSLLDSILFSIDYQKANPSERVFVCPREEFDRQNHGHFEATIVYSQNNRFFFRHLDTGDLPCSLSLDDLKDPDKVIRADKEVFHPARKKFLEDEKARMHQPSSGLVKYLNGYKAPDLSVTGLLAELQKRGVEAKIIDNTDQPELRFVWSNQAYKYIPGTSQGTGCTKAE